MAEFSLFGGHLSPSKLAKWLQQKEDAPIPPKDEKQTTLQNISNIMQVHAGLYEFIHGVIVSPEKYGFDKTPTVLNEKKYFFRLLAPFFSPGLELEDLILKPDETLQSKREAWNVKRTKEFNAKLKDFDAELKEWVKTRSTMPPAPPTPNPEFRTVISQFEQYQHQLPLPGDEKDIINFMTNNCSRAVRKPITMQLPGKGGAIRGPIQGLRNLEFYDVGAALGFLFSIHPPTYRHASGADNNAAYTVKEKLDSYYYPAVILFAGLLTALPVSFAMAAVTVLRRESDGGDSDLEAADCLDGFFSSTANADFESCPQMLRWTDKGKNQPASVTRYPASTQYRAAVAPPLKITPPVLKELVVARKFEMIYDTFGKLRETLSISFPNDKPGKYEFPPIWPLKEQLLAKLAGDLVKGRVGNQADQYYTPRPNPPPNLLLEAEKLRPLFEAGTLPEPQMTNLEMIFNYFPTCNTREFFDTANETYHYPFYDVFRSKAIKYTRVDMENGSVLPSEDIHPDTGAEMNPQAGSNEVYRAAIDAAIVKLTSFKEPKEAPDGDHELVIPPPDQKVVKFKIAPGEPLADRVESLQNQTADILPRVRTDQTNNLLTRYKQLPLTSAQHAVYFSSAIARKNPQRFGHCAEAYPIVYYATIAELTEHERLKTHPDPNDPQTKPYPLVGVSIRPSALLFDKLKKLKNASDPSNINFPLPQEFSIARHPFNADAVQDDAQPSDPILVEDPCHNCKGLLRLFQNTRQPDLHDYDEYLRPMREPVDAVGDAHGQIRKTWIRVLDEGKRCDMFYPVPLRDNDPGWAASQPHALERTAEEGRRVARGPAGV